MTFRFLAAALLCAAGVLSSPADAGNLWPPRSYEPGVITEWNSLLVNALPPTLGAKVPRYYALMHIAMYDAVNSIEGGGDPMRARVPAARHASSDAAAAQAAHDVLVALLPDHKVEFDAALIARLGSINPERARLGSLVGRAVAQRVLDWGTKNG